MLIGKETRNIERAGITEDPTHTFYTDVERDAWTRIFLPTLRVLAPGRIPRGRPTREQRNRLAQQAGELARAALHEGDNAQLARSPRLPSFVPDLPGEVTGFFEEAEKSIATHPAQSVVGGLLVGILIGRLLGRR